MHGWLQPPGTRNRISGIAPEEVTTDHMGLLPFDHVSSQIGHAVLHIIAVAGLLKELLCLGLSETIYSSRFFDRRARRRHPAKGVVGDYPVCHDVHTSKETLGYTVYLATPCLRTKEDSRGSPGDDFDLLLMKRVGGSRTICTYMRPCGSTRRGEMLLCDRCRLLCLFQGSQTTTALANRRSSTCLF
ncbi:hypothetical protein LZ30DRAFT_699596 [Colletotrichum cereale]|nr:hypothetical protein LZ30DRAFT_699596 [Colletotrichum cereale]